MALTEGVLLIEVSSIQGVLICKIGGVLIRGVPPYLGQFGHHYGEALLEIVRPLHVSLLVQRIQVTESSHTHLLKEGMLNSVYMYVRGKIIL